MKLGRLVYKAIDQIQMLKRFYRYRYEFLNGIGLVFVPKPEIDLGYKPIPHFKFNKTRADLMVSSDNKYLFDEVNEPPEILKDNLIKVADGTSLIG